MKDLTEIRQELDEIDKEMITLFERRMELAGSVAEFKMATGKAVRDAVREEQKIEAAAKMVEDPFCKQGTMELMRQIMAISRKRQYLLMEEKGFGSRMPFMQVDDLPGENVRVVYQGVPGAYSHIASMKFFGEEFKGYYVKFWEDAMNALSGGRADYAVLPIENSTAGVVGDVYDLLAKYDNYIVGEEEVTVEHALLGLPGAALDSINTVYSHPQALMQCQKYLNEHRDWNQVSVENTAVGAQRVVKEQDPTHAAIASELCGELNGLKVLKKPVNANHSNTTRFIICTNRKICLKRAGRILICFEIAHEAGSLYNILSHFIFNGLNMTNIEARPVAGATWEYRFFVEFEGNLEDSGVRNALNGISEEATSMKILGNY